MKKKFNVLAQFTISDNSVLPTTKGIKSGYIPHHKFNKWDYLLSGLHDYDDEIYHFSGETLVTKISFLSWDDIKHDIKINDKFEVSEVNKHIGNGVILEIFE